MIKLPDRGRRIRPTIETPSSDDDDATSWIDQPAADPDVAVVDSSSSKSYSEEKLVAKVKEMYAVTKDVAEATNQPEWMYQRLVDAALTELDYDKHMLVMVGENVEPSWQKAPVNIIPENYRENNKATEFEFSNIQVKNRLPFDFRYFMLALIG